MTSSGLRAWTGASGKGRRSRHDADTISNMANLHGLPVLARIRLTPMCQSQPRTHVLGCTFFGRPAAVVARDLLGKRLVRRLGEETRSVAIMEAEAYEGPHDLACHAARGRTPRTEVMFAPPGILYVYLVYGMHWMLNVVTNETGYPAAVLIRGVEGISGPARVCGAFGIDGRLNGRPAAIETGLWFEDNPHKLTRPIRRTARIGVNYAGPKWSAKKLRFILAKDRTKRLRSSS
jgi:DNA-3-methyladenine glycosylase